MGGGKERRRDGMGGGEGTEGGRKENTLPPLPWIRNQFTTSPRHPPWPCIYRERGRQIGCSRSKSKIGKTYR